MSIYKFLYFEKIRVKRSFFYILALHTHYFMSLLHYKPIFPQEHLKKLSTI